MLNDPRDENLAGIVGSPHSSLGLEVFWGVGGKIRLILVVIRRYLRFRVWSHEVNKVIRGVRLGSRKRTAEEGRNGGSHIIGSNKIEAMAFVIYYNALHMRTVLDP
ncbi:hypothetical protein PM082_014963 [Marasmius tenuissimus]|nr:hypothetical protein PM082_014963 [Marasmius tenuissimus]